MAGVRTLWARISVAALALAFAAATPGGARADEQRPAPVSATAGVIERPGIRIDVPNKRLEIEAWFVVTSPEVRLEYLLTTPEGKLHETLLASRCSAQDLMLGLILIGLAPQNELRGRGDARALSAPRVGATARWRDASGREQTRPVEELLFDLFHGRSPRALGFAFTGSRFVEAERTSKNTGEVLAASVSGSLIALYHDPDAVLDNPRLVGGDVPVLAPTFLRPEVVRLLPGDERYVANPDLVPARGSALTLTLVPLEEADAGGDRAASPAPTDETDKRSVRPAGNDDGKERPVAGE